MGERPQGGNRKTLGDPQGLMLWPPNLYGISGVYARTFYQNLVAIGPLEGGAALGGGHFPPAVALY